MSHARVLISPLGVAFLALSAALLAGSACDRHRAGSEGEEEPPRSPDSVREMKGEPCANDLECSAYLRCLSETCDVPPAMEGEAGPETPRVEFETASEEDSPTFYVELATTPAARRRGLMERPEMQRDWGMLFVFDRAEPRSFWMKNTLIPLDMIFMDRRGRVVKVIHEAPPETTTPQRSERPAQFVLELKGGMAREHGIERGSRMTVENIPEEFAPEP